MSPLPPPIGGISNWSILLKSHIENQKNISSHFISTAPKIRSVDGRSIFNRVVVSGFQILALKRKLKKKLTKTSFDAVHITTSGSLAIFRDILLLKYLKRKKINTIYHLHFGRIPEIAKNNTREWKRIKKAMALASIVVSIDSKTFLTINEYAPKSNVVNIANPIDIKKLPIPSENKQNFITFLGWVIKEKGIEELLQAWQEIYDNDKSWTLKIIGPFKETYYKSLIENFKTDGVEFLNEQPHQQAMQILNSGKIFVLPSYTEGFPNVILEAMALKNAIVATDVGAISEILSNDCGVIVKAKDGRQLKDELLNLMNNEKKISNLSNNAFKKVIAEYDIDTIFKKYQELWVK